MTRTCTICTHPERGAINAALIANDAYRRIATQYNVSEAAVRRHRAEHMVAELARAQQAKQDEDYDLLTQLRGLRTKAIGILMKAEGAHDLRTALLAIREARGCIETLLEVEGELKRQPVINLHLSPEWQRMQVVLMTVLAPYPDARIAVSRALLEEERD